MENAFDAEDQPGCRRSLALCAGTAAEFRDQMRRGRNHPMDLGLQGKAAIVTGASRGIGRAIALGLAREGADVLAVARSANLLEELAATPRTGQGRIHPLTADLREADGIARAVAGAEREFGRLDLLVNNAGTTRRGD